MTFRTRTAQTPSRRRTRRSDTRRAIYITVTFSLAIAVALAMMGGVFFASYYSAHWAPIAGVNGQAISHDDVTNRANVNMARYQRQLADYTTLRNQGKITSDEFSTISQTIATSESTVLTDALTEIENELEVRQWAAKNGISVTSQQVDDKIKDDGTIPAMRHVMVIGVAPEPALNEYSVTDAEEQTAQKQAQAYLDEIKGGKKWADVATESHAGNVGASGTTGDLGLMKQSDKTLDPDLRDAIFALGKVNDITPIFKGTDGVYRFATVTEIVPEFVDPNWTNYVNGDTYRSREEGAAIQDAVQKAIENKYVSSPTVQRRVLEISVAPSLAGEGYGDEIHIRMMVFAPSHSTSAASSLAATDPAWTDAKNRADAAVATLKADPSKFDSMARDSTINDDTYFGSEGGLLPWIPADLFNSQTQSGQGGLGLPALQAAVFDTSLQPGAIVGPILESSEGYVVAQLEGRRPAPEIRIAQAQFQLNSGVDFATVAQTYSETVDAANGAELGWVAPYQLDAAEQQAIFSTPVGSVTPMVNDNGYHVYKIVEEKTQVQDAAGQAQLKDVVFARWLQELQGNALIWTDSAAVSALSSATP